MVSDFNENWYLGVFWSEELVGNDETCIHMPEFWYGDFCVCIQTESNLVIIIKFPSKVWELIVFPPFLIIIIIIIIIILPSLLLAVNLSDQILRDWSSDLY
jgi:hypothetical protein